MKFYVFGKRYKYSQKGFMAIRIFIALWVLWLIFILIDVGKSDIHIMWPYIFVTAGLIMFCILIVRSMRYEGSVISFEDDAITSTFKGRTKTTILYREIIEYGIVMAFYNNIGVVVSLFISRIELPEKRNIREIYRVYAKTDDVIIVQYHDDILEKLKTHIPNFDMDKITSGLPMWWPPTTPAEITAACAVRVPE